MTSNSAGPPLFTPTTPANESLSSSSYFPSNQSSTTARPHHGNVARDRPTLAIDPIALVTTECITITSAMRKNARWAHSSVASILGGGGSATQSASNLLDSSRPATPLPGTPMNSKMPKLNRDTDELATNRWGLRGKKGKSIQDNPLIAAFSKLRAGLSSCRDIMTYDTPSLLHPFLQVIRSSSISGPITSLALVSITKFLSYNIINTNSPRLPLTMQMLAAAITHCRFEGENSAQDEVVLLRILNLMEKMITGPGGELLGDESVCEMMETGLSICCQQKVSEVLKRSAEITMISIVQVIFERLKQLEIEVEDLELLPGNSKEDMDQLKMDPSAPAAEVTEDPIVTGEETTPSPSSEPKGSEDSNAPSESAIPTVHVEKPTAETDIDSDFEPEIRPYGLPAIRELFRVLVVELLDPHNTIRSDRMRIMALRMIDVALETAGPSIAKHPSLANSAKDDLCRFLLQLVKSDNTQLLSHSLRVVGTLFATCRGVLKLQQELFLSYVVSCLYPRVEIPREPGVDPSLYEGVPQGPKQSKASSTPAAANGSSGRSTPVPIKERKQLGLEGGARRPDAREAMVESICQLVRIPGFMTELFVNYDCDVDRNDMCEDLVGLLSRNAFPDSATWSTTNVPPLCLDSILNYISNMADRLEDEGDKEGRYPNAKKLMEQRDLKQTIIQGAKEFNDSPKKGLAFLAKRGIIDNLENPASIAKFLVSSSRLNKKLIGEYISKKENDAVLKAFMQEFDFQGKRVDEALRQLLEKFRLPGESQLIERIVVTFADKYCSDGHPEEVANEDAVFVLCYAIIMLNTDQHNPNVKTQNRMTFTDFSRNLRGVNDGKDFDPAYLQSIYDAIKTKEIILPEEHDTKDAFDLAWKELLAKTEHCGEMILCDNTNIFDEYIFHATWKPIVATLSYVFASASDDAVFSRVITGFDQCATIAAKYHLTECLDHIVKCLGNISTLSNAPMPSTSLNTEVQTNGNSVMVSELAVRFGRDFKAQLATVVLYRVVTGNESHLRKGWEHIFKGLLALFLNSLIPPYFSNVQTALALPSIPMRPPQAVVAKVEQSRDVGLFSTLTSYLASYASDEPPEPSEEELESTLCTVDCINSCGLGAMFSNLAELDIESLEAVVDTLLNQLPEDSSELVILKAEPTPAEALNGGPAPVDPKNVYDPAVVYVLELLTCLVLRDEKTTEALGKKLADSLQGILRSAARVHNIIISRTVYYLFSLLQASHQHSFLNTPIVLHSIAILDKPTLEYAGETVVKGISKCIYQSPGSPSSTPLSSALRKEMINSPDFWVLLRSLLGSKAAALEVFQILKVIAENPQDNVTADNYENVVALLNEFASAGSVCAVWDQKQDAIASKRGKKAPPSSATGIVRPDQEILDLSTTSITLLQSLSSHIPTLILQSHLPRLEAWSTYWHQMFNALANQCSNPCRTIRQLAFVSLQRTLLSRALQVDSSDGRTQETTAKGVFQSVLFPLMSHLLKPEIYQSDPKGMSETRLQAATMLCKIFLHNLGNVDKGEWFASSSSMASSSTPFPEQDHEDVGFWYNHVWVKILDVLDRLVNSGQGENLEEAVVECLKNVLLVMNSGGYLVDDEVEGRKVWEGTWGRIDRFLPGLRKDLGLDRPKVVEVPKEPVEEKKEVVVNVTETSGGGEAVPVEMEAPRKKMPGKDE